MPDTDASKLDAWRTIETAPRDGTWIFAFGSHRRHICAFGVVQWADGFDDQWLSADDGYAAYLTPTHWKPLPAPPVQEDVRPPAEPDQDTLDTRAVLAAWWGYERYDHDNTATARAKVALIAIKAREVAAEREAACKWLREQPDSIDAMKGNIFAHYIARGEHRDTRP